MKVIDKIFGELEYDDVWERDIELDFMEDNCDAVLQVMGEEDAIFDEGQYQTYQELMKKWDTFQSEIMESIYKYYRKQKDSYGYTEEDGYPDEDSAEELAYTLSLQTIVVFGTIDDNIRRMGILFGCSWDEEYGVGVMLEDEKIVEVGTQNIVM